MSGTESAVRLNVFCVAEFLGDDRRRHRRWTRVGVAFPHREGAGMNIVLDALPLDGKLVVLERSDDADAEGHAEEHAGGVSA
jgi:hypothetical protein